MTDIFLTRGSLERDEFTERTLCEEEVRGDASPSQGLPKIASRPSGPMGQA
jgi:hypothetical protein